MSKTLPCVLMRPGSSLNSKVAIVSRSSEPHCDPDYVFAQVGIDQCSVDLRPNCNTLSDVLPYVIDQSLIEAGEGTTSARIFDVNTRSRHRGDGVHPGRRLPSKTITMVVHARPSNFARRWRAGELAKWKRVVQQAKLKAE
ncbi:MAG TPA: PrpF domain-containing protein [Ideonella sp.]|nr:PrpF domain-containing protein [Ideonella sp.]